jgi:hypothetical protein
MKSGGGGARSSRSGSLFNAESDSDATELPHEFALPSDVASGGSGGTPRGGGGPASALREEEARSFARAAQRL